MKQITRTIEEHKIYASSVKMENGELVQNELEPVFVMNESMNPQKALKKVKKAHGKDQQYVITNIETTATTYAIDFDTFMQNAKPVGTAVKLDLSEYEENEIQ